MVAVAVLRFFRLDILPIFNDEAIYLRWAQIIADDPSLAIRIPLLDPKPPFHIALLSIFTSTAIDPLATARAVSVIAGVVMIPIAVLLLRELDTSESGVAAAVAFIATSPFLSFYQRLATADALFVTESVVCVWLSLRLARRPTTLNTVLLGLMLGVALLTRQVFSLALLPITLAAVISFRAERRAALRWVAAVLIGIALLTPYLMTNRAAYAGGIAPELTRRLLHTSQLRDLPAAERLAAIGRNAGDISSWLFHYLTPPLAVAALASIAWLLLRRPRIALLLAGWAAVMLAPTIAFGVVTYPRYVLAATIPLLLGLAIAIGAIANPATKIGILVLLLVWPVRDLALQLTTWDRQALLPIDRRQYVSGWSGGFAMGQAIQWIEARLASDARATFITGEGWGIPDDVIWVRFARDPRVTLRYVPSTKTVPDLATTETFSPTWHPDAKKSPTPSSGAVYYFARLVGQEPMQSGGPTVEDPIPFINPRFAPREPYEGVVIYRLR